eukprot:m.153481 g.153481  ORF g.153481 m.153481 type:complete len:184 (-) comp14349_c0_seq10:808-1359(-)
MGSRLVTVLPVVPEPSHAVSLTPLATEPLASCVGAVTSHTVLTLVRKRSTLSDTKRSGLWSFIEGHCTCDADTHDLSVLVVFVGSSNPTILMISLTEGWRESRHHWHEDGTVTDTLCRCDGGKFQPQSHSVNTPPLQLRSPLHAIVMIGRASTSRDNTSTNYHHHAVTLTTLVQIGSFVATNP